MVAVVVGLLYGMAVGGCACGAFRTRRPVGSCYCADGAKAQLLCSSCLAHKGGQW